MGSTVGFGGSADDGCGAGERGRAMFANEMGHEKHHAPFENEWQSFRNKKDRSLELTSVALECPSGRRKAAAKVVDIFGNDTMTIVEVTV